MFAKVVPEVVQPQAEARTCSDLEQLEGLGKRSEQRKECRATPNLIRLRALRQHDVADSVPVSEHALAKLLISSRCSVKISDGTEQKVRLTLVKWKQRQELDELIVLGDGQC
jgi:hypothetical protein